MRNKNSTFCIAETQPMVNGDMSALCIKPAAIDVCDLTDVNSETVVGPKPSAERCRSSETGDQLQTYDIPLSATSPTSEDGRDCCASVNSNEKCSDIGKIDSYVIVFSSLASVVICQA